MPLAVAMLNVSAPAMGPMDMLSRLSHDNDEAVAQNAILALGAHSKWKLYTSPWALYPTQTRRGAVQAASAPAGCDGDNAIFVARCKKCGTGMAREWQVRL